MQVVTTVKKKQGLRFLYKTFRSDSVSAFKLIKLFAKIVPTFY